MRKDSIIYKSPFNYIGNKFRMLKDLKLILPNDSDNFIDLFCGGCDVVTNINAGHKFANDINYHLIEILKAFQSMTLQELLDKIDGIIIRWKLTKTDKAAYENFRNHYNNSSRDAIELFVLMCYSFNYQFRFNAAHEYNNPFGNNRSCFSSSMRQNLISFHRLISDIIFTSSDFINFDYDIVKEGDIVYADPPYSLTCGSYNDGKRGFRGWSLLDDQRLMRILDTLSTKGVRFALSNVIEHKGETHLAFNNWVQRNGYNIIDINIDYNNCNYQTRNKQFITREVVITNYTL
ncbi:MAG: Dam family site-specific DNA-(adenine-N6)-methyltransferase [Muribaculaceae bacterium]|nr:Dam family site-specific DNA-(adenine-N6)-methyltransferase [Muribaculaceae bacterium]